MKKKYIFSFVAVVTVIALNVQWLGLAQEGFIFNLVNAGGEGTGINTEFNINGIGYDFLNFTEVQDGLTPGDVTQTATVPNSAVAGIKTKLTCPWDCGESYWFPEGFYAIPEMCTEGNLLILDIQEDIVAGRTGDWDGAGTWGANSVYDAGEKVAWDGLWVWERYNITTGIGWTGWWAGLANYCEANGWWSDSNKENVVYGGTVTLTFTIAENIVTGDVTYTGNLLAKDSTLGLLRMQGSSIGTIIAGGQTVTTPSFNSPFIYFSNMPNGDYAVKLDSDWDRYQAVSPAFSSGSLWDINVNSDKVNTVEGEYEHLFYELAMSRIDLSRNGVNFNSKESLVEFLDTSDFFENLHMTSVEKANSLDYLIPRLPDSSNYYLTILSDDAINSLSEISVSPKPEQMVRTYYAIYPTKTPVKTTGVLDYPEPFDTSKPTVKEYGEIIVKPEMYVIWK